MPAGSIHCLVNLLQASRLKYLAEAFQIPVLVTNQVTTRIGGDASGGGDGAQQGQLQVRGCGCCCAAGLGVAGAVSWQKPPPKCGALRRKVVDSGEQLRQRLPRLRRSAA